MLEVPKKSPEQIWQMAEGFAEGRLFSGLHILLGPGYSDRGKALRTCFLPLDKYTPAQWTLFQQQKCVPVQWTSEATAWLSRNPPLPVFHTFEFLTWEDGLAVMRLAEQMRKKTVA